MILEVMCKLKHLFCEMISEKNSDLVAHSPVNHGEITLTI